MSDPLPRPARAAREIIHDPRVKSALRKLEAEISALEPKPPPRPKKRPFAALAATVLGHGRWPWYVMQISVALAVVLSDIQYQWIDDTGIAVAVSIVAALLATAIVIHLLRFAAYLRRAFRRGRLIS